MAEDQEILREIWEGKIPVSFQLASEEIYTVEHPDPFFLMVPRLSYFPLVTDKLIKHMEKHLEPNNHKEPNNHREMWLEYEGQPLRWHYPIGVLFDLYGHHSELPWKLTVHFQNFPEDDLLNCPNKDAVESHFMSVIKEADAMKHRSQAINSMQKKDHKALWGGFMNVHPGEVTVTLRFSAHIPLKDKFNQFWSVNKKLMENSGEDSFKYIPFRIYKIEKSSSQQTDHVTIQKLFKPSEDGGENSTLRHLLDVAVPDLAEKGELVNYHVVTQGIQPAMETPVVWMSEHLSYPDNFLHICLVPRVDNES